MVTVSRGSGQVQSQQLALHIGACERVSAWMASLAMRHCRNWFVKAVARHPNPMELVVSSVCPEIIGHDFVKFGLTLALFGNM